MCAQPLNRKILLTTDDLDLSYKQDFCSSADLSFFFLCLFLNQCLKIIIQKVRVPMKRWVWFFNSYQSGSLAITFGELWTKLDAFLVFFLTLWLQGKKGDFI